MVLISNSPSTTKIQPQQHFHSKCKHHYKDKNINIHQTLLKFKDHVLNLIMPDFERNSWQAQLLLLIFWNYHYQMKSLIVIFHL
jgi:hypothetical protein